MPAVSEKQRKFMGADLARKRAGKKTRTGMSESQLKHYAAGVVKGSGLFTKAEKRRGYKVVARFPSESPPSSKGHPFGG